MNKFRISRTRKINLVAVFCVFIYILYYIFGTRMHFFYNKNCYYNSLSPFPKNSSCNELLYPNQSSLQFGKICFLAKTSCYKTQQQYAYIPPQYKESTSEEKQILILTNDNGLGNMYILNGTKSFENCPVKKCSISTLNSKVNNLVPDAVIYKHVYVEADIPYKPRQVRIFFSQESPYSIPSFEEPSIINWTATYREDSDIPAPYKEWIYSDEKHLENTNINYAKNKTKMVAWYVSNCRANNDRLEYAKELQKYISVDIYGKCGDKKCDRSKEKQCLEQLRKYKFYLSFENSNCIDYITEKLYLNALQYDAIPVVMGAPIASYRKFAPKNSFIHVDEFGSAQQLAEYLHQLDQNEELYNSFFKWKNKVTFLEKSFYCRLCSMLHSDYTEKYYKDINVWWKMDGTCAEKSWND